jgi:sugar-specific transcriptional regulator TrmB
MIDFLLQKLGFSSEEIKTYLFILENGEQAAGSLSRKIGLPRPSVYGFLKRLSERGLVIESQKNGVKIFSAAPAEKIKLLFDEEIENLEHNKREFEKMLPELAKGFGPGLSPKFQLFEGKSGLQQMMKDVLLYRNLPTVTYWPIKEMIDVLGADFFRYHNKERIKRNISIRAIWPEEKAVSVKEHPYLGVGQAFLREIRIAPKSVDFSMGYWIYGNKVMCISSKKEGFGFVIESHDFAEVLRSQYEIVWSNSKTLTVLPEDTAEFEKELRSPKLDSF